jgi:hypothetical protein
MIGLPNDVSRTDSAVRQAFETALKVMIEAFEKARSGNPPMRRTHALAIPRFAWAAWFFPDRSTTKASAVSCARLLKRPHSSLVSGKW